MVDDHVWDEIRNFKKCLVRMNSELGLETLFLESAINVTEPKTHAAVECLPFPTGGGNKAEKMLKSEIDSTTSEWSTHYAKRLIATSR